jgi:hypothetical protein
MEKGIIEKLKLTELQVLEIVLQWYTCGMFSDILENEEGLDLEEIIEYDITLIKLNKN